MIQLKRNTVNNKVVPIDGSKLDTPKIPEQLKQVTVTEDNDQASNLVLERGSYKIKFTLGNASNLQPQTILNEWKGIKQDGETKRVFFHKVDTWPDPDNPKNLKVVALVTVVDNPLPLIPLVWGGVAVAGAVGAWFFVDKTESFVQESSFNIISILLSIFLIFFISR